MPRPENSGPIIRCGALALVLSACFRAPADPRVDVPLVRVATVGATGQATHEFTGIVSARVQSDLGFRVPGKIVTRLVDTGQVVRRGQPLTRIDRTDLALATVAQVGSVAAARARALQTAADEKRYRDLVSASTYDQAKAAASRSACSMSQRQESQYHRRAA